MKSIVQEGSTISKAVESAWQSAGQPKEFTVKILEEPQHNFIGMTTRSAKVAIFFKQFATDRSSDRAARSDRPDRGRSRQERPRRQTRGPRPARRDTEKSPRYKKDERGQREQKPTTATESRNDTYRAVATKQERPSPVKASEERPVSRQREERRPVDQAVSPVEEKRERPEYDGIFWTPEMIVMAKSWLQESLSKMELGHVTYNTDVNRLYLRVFFDEPVRKDVTTEKQIFRSFALLLMQHMRNRLRRPLRGFKVVLSRGES